MKKTLNIAVCDDEKAIREQIRELLERENRELSINLYETGDELLSAGGRFDIAFLDIQMEGTNGIETARRLRAGSGAMGGPIVVFITGIREYVFEAFDVEAFHYLLKPVSEKKFHEVFGRALRELERKEKRRCETIVVKVGSRSFALEKGDILYVESRAKKEEIHTVEETLEVYGSMGEMEKRLGEDFFRCHRGYLVNLAHIAEYDDDSILLDNGEHIYLSKAKYGEFVKTYMRYLRNEVGVNE